MNLITLALIAAMVVVVVSLYMLQTPWKSKLPVFFSSGIGVGCLLFEYIHLNMGINTPIGKVTLEELEATLQIGAFGTIIGFILAIVGVWKYPNSGDG